MTTLKLHHRLLNYSEPPGACPAVQLRRKRMVFSVDQLVADCAAAVQDSDGHSAVAVEEVEPARERGVRAG